MVCLFNQYIGKDYVDDVYYFFVGVDDVFLDGVLLSIIECVGSLDVYLVGFLNVDDEQIVYLCDKFLD